ncbi:MAG: NAD(P)/FAD-dependent oxidoreductase [Luteitalea sp.]|nr:NAD(P)/FAD-dependent oxidoreductase [Luteitalea sp.]
MTHEQNRPDESRAEVLESTVGEARAGHVRAPRINVASHAGRPRVVIIGGGFGGLNAARALKHAAVDVVVVDRYNHHLFQPLLYQVATAGLSPGEIASPIRWILRRLSNVQVLLADARAVDRTRRVVELDIGELSYDYLIIASGSAHAYFGHDEWAPMAPGLKTLDDALFVRRRLLMAFERAEVITDPEVRRQLLTFVIVGGGPTGVEMAGAMAELARHALVKDFRAINPRDARIVLVEGASSILTAFPPALQARAEQSLAGLGVEVRKGTLVTGVTEGAVQAGDERIDAGTVIWAAGVAASPLGRTLGAPVDRVGRVRVEPDLSVPGSPEVFVIGDLAYREQEGKPLPGVAQVAIQGGRHAAASVVRLTEHQPTQAFRYRDLGNMATIGRAAAIAEIGRMRFSGWLAWLVWLFVHIMALTGFRNRVIVLVQWAWAYITYQRGIRLITGQGTPPGSRQ